MAESKKANTLRVLIPVLVISIIVLGVTTFLLRGEQVKMIDAVGARSAIDVRVGATLPDLELTRMDGTKQKLSEARKKVTLLSFWATWCGPCVEELPALKKLRETYKDQGFEVLGINMDEDPAEAIPPFLKKIPIEFPLYVDPEGTLADRLSIGGLPFNAVVDDKGKVLLVELGEREWMSDADQAQLRSWLGTEKK